MTRYHVHNKLYGYFAKIKKLKGKRQSRKVRRTINRLETLCLQIMGPRMTPEQIKEMFSPFLFYNDLIDHLNQ